jgi:O-antigen ligase
MESRAPMIATHSGWVELGLAFGIPILVLIFAIFIILLRNTYRNAYPTKMTILSFVILLPFLYLVGEVAIDHGLEILFYLLALCCSLILIKPNDSFLLRSEK